MKKLLSLGFLATCVFLASERPAHAWVNSKFSVGLTWHYQSGNNSFLWGLWRNGQVPGWYDCGPGPAFTPPPAPDHYPYHAAAPAPAAAMTAQPGQPPARDGIQQAWQLGTIPSWNGDANIYQNTSYPGYGQPGYTYPNYYYPGYSGVPSYWYGQ